LADPAINCSRVGGGMKGRIAPGQTTAGAVAEPPFSPVVGFNTPNCLA